MLDTIGIWILAILTFASQNSLISIHLSIPEVYVYDLTPEWVQVILINNDKKKEKTISAPLSGDQAETGSLGLDNNKSYYAFDFWNQKFIGRLMGNGKLISDIYK